MSSERLAIIDYGMGNLHSVASAVQHVAPELDVVVTRDEAIIESADRVIFPGVGAIRDCMAEIRRLGLDKVVAREIQSGKPMLAICVGMQGLLTASEENGGVDCLAHVQGDVLGFSANDTFRAASQNVKLKVPHMGWNQVSQVIDHPLWQGIPDHSRFYFVHSYFCQVADTALVAGESHYGTAFTAAIARKNVFATQFHPEKSHDMGLALIRNFAHWQGA